MRVSGILASGRRGRQSWRRSAICAVQSVVGVHRVGGLVRGPAIEPERDAGRVGAVSVRRADVEAFAEEGAVAIDARDGEAVRQAELDLGAEQPLHVRLAAGAREKERIVGGLPGGCSASRTRRRALRRPASARRAAPRSSPVRRRGSARASQTRSGAVRERAPPRSSWRKQQPRAVRQSAIASTVSPASAA